MVSERTTARGGIQVFTKRLNNMKKHSEARQSSFRNYVSRHSRLLIFVGALIVFVTYLVKDGLRERLKDRSIPLIRRRVCSWQNEKTSRCHKG
jgi:hypothetical protein